MLKIAICDDEEIYLNDIKEMLEVWSASTSFKVSINCYNNGDLLVKQSENLKFDIVFLDIVMPLLNGMEAATELRQRDKEVKIIFITSSPEFALQSYSVKAADYCIKPVSYDKLKEVMDSCTASKPLEAKSLLLKAVGGFQKVYLHDIEYIEVQNKSVFFFLRSGKVVEVIQHLYSFESELSNSEGFFKCHRSYLVNLSNVQYFCNTEIKTKSGRRVPISRGYAKSFQDAYFNTMFKK